MEKEMIIKKFEELFGEKFTDMKSLEEKLSDKFEENCDKVDDAQVAFDNLDDDTNQLLGQYFCYTLSAKGETWGVNISSEFDNKSFPQYKKSFEDYYNQEFNTVDDMLSKLERQVMKTMSNVGCDAKTALNMILEEDLILEGVFRIYGADATPRIEYVA